MNQITQEWISKAEQDYLVAIREIAENPLAADAVCFHSQQCIEKYLKAVLQENNTEFTRTHDLAVLMQNCLLFVPELIPHQDDAIKISMYAVDVRYPGFGASEDQAHGAVQTMIKVRKIIRTHLDVKE